MLRLVLVGVLLTGCAGASEFDGCVAHSVEEGVDRERAEEGCAQVTER